MNRTRSGPTETPPPVRVMGVEFQPAASTELWMLAIMAVCADTSTCWPRPDRRRSSSATMIALAASAPACRKAWGTEQVRGGRSESPVRFMAVDAAVTVRSVAGQSRLGPVAP